MQALHRLEQGCSRKEFNDLCFCLTLPGVRSHPDYSAWTPELGRLWCFEALREYLGLLFPGQELPVEVCHMHMQGWFLFSFINRSPEVSTACRRRRRRLPPQTPWKAVIFFPTRGKCERTGRQTDKPYLNLCIHVCLKEQMHV